MLVFIQNDPEVPAGIYADRLTDAGMAFRIVRIFRHEEIPPLTETSAVVVLGGSMGVHDSEKHPFLVTVKDFIQEIVDAGKPYLGICLGGQLLADVLRAKVNSNAHGEIGVNTVRLDAPGIEDPLFHSMPEQFFTFQWHNDSFAIPEKGIRLAWSDVCPNQAFRYGDKAYGLQFHPEVNEQIVMAWCHGFESGNSSPENIIARFRDVKDVYRSCSLQILNNFLKISRLIP